VDPSGSQVVEAAARQGSTYKFLGKLSGQDARADYPRVGIDRAGDAVAVWQDFEQGHNVVQTAAFTPDGGVASLSDLSDSGIDAQVPRVAVDPTGDAVAVWQQTVGTDVSIHAAARAAGHGFVSLGEVSAAMRGQDDEEPRVAIDQAGDAIVVWQHFDGTNFVAQAAIRRAGAANFTILPTPASPPQSQAHENASPELAVNSAGDAVIVWQLGCGPSGDACQVQAAELRAGTSSFTTPQNLSAPAEDARDPSVAVDQAGNAVTVWQRFDPLGAFVDTATLAAGASTWNTVELPATISSLVPDVAADPAGDALAVWAGPDGVNSSIYSAFRPAGAAFAAPLPLSVLGQSAVDPHVALDQADEPFAVWERSDGHNTIATAYLPTPPPTGLPPTPLPPPGGCTPHPGLPPCPPARPQPQPPRLRLLRLAAGTFSTAGRLVHGHCVSPTRVNRKSRRCIRPLTLTVSFTVTASATVALAVRREMTGRVTHDGCIPATAKNRRARRCRRLIALPGRVTHQAHTGVNRFLYTRQGLSPGSYQLLAIPDPMGNDVQPTAVPFKVVS
jgi:hypothetical protein